jgi:hypothetical protein
MWKKVLLVSTVTDLLTGALIPIQSAPADAARSGCHNAAKAKYPGDHKARKQWRHYCKGQWKIYKAAHKGAPKS